MAVNSIEELKSLEGLTWDELVEKEPELELVLIRHTREAERIRCNPKVMLHAYSYGAADITKQRELEWALYKLLGYKTSYGRYETLSAFDLAFHKNWSLVINALVEAQKLEVSDG